MLIVIIFAEMGMAIDVPFVFDENISKLAGSDPNQLEVTSLLSRDLVGIPSVSYPDYDFIIEVALTSNESINRSDNCTKESQSVLSGLVLSNSSNIENATNSSAVDFYTAINPYYSIAVAAPVLANQKEYWFTEGNKNYNGSKYLKAIDCYDRAIELDSRLKEAWCNRGLALCRLGKYQDAIDSFGQALIIDQDYSNAKRNRDIALKKIASNTWRD